MESKTQTNCADDQTRLKEISTLQLKGYMINLLLNEVCSECQELVEQIIQRDTNFISFARKIDQNYLQQYITINNKRLNSLTLSTGKLFSRCDGGHIFPIINASDSPKANPQLNHNIVEKQTKKKQQIIKKSKITQIIPKNSQKSPKNEKQPSINIKLESKHQINITNFTQVTTFVKTVAKKTFSGIQSEQHHKKNEDYPKRTSNFEQNDRKPHQNKNYLNQNNEFNNKNINESNSQSEFYNKNKHQINKCINQQQQSNNYLFDSCNLDINLPSISSGFQHQNLLNVKQTSEINRGHIDFPTQNMNYHIDDFYNQEINLKEFIEEEEVKSDKNRYTQMKQFYNINELIDLDDQMIIEDNIDNEMDLFNNNTTFENLTQQQQNHKDNFLENYVLDFGDYSKLDKIEIFNETKEQPKADKRVQNNQKQLNDVSMNVSSDNKQGIMKNEQNQMEETQEDTQYQLKLQNIYDQSLTSQQQKEKSQKKNKENSSINLEKQVKQKNTTSPELVQNSQEEQLVQQNNPDTNQFWNIINRDQIGLKLLENVQFILHLLIFLGNLSFIQTSIFYIDKKEQQRKNGVSVGENCKKNEFRMEVQLPQKNDIRTIFQQQIRFMNYNCKRSRETGRTYNVSRVSEIIVKNGDSVSDNQDCNMYNDPPKKKTQRKPIVKLGTVIKATDTEQIKEKKLYVQKKFKSFVEQLLVLRDKMITSCGVFRYPYKLQLIVAVFMRYYTLTEVQRETFISSETIRKWQRVHWNTPESILDKPFF